MQTIYYKHISTRQIPKNLKTEDLKLFAHEFSKEIRETTIIKLRNVYVLKDSIFSLWKIRFYLAYSHWYKLSKKLLLKRFLMLFSRGEKIDKAVWIIDTWSIGYFHWLTDALPRLIASENFINNNVIILPGEFKTHNYVNESLKFLNFRVHFYNKTLLVKELVLPSHTASTGNYNKEIICRLRDKFLKHSSLNPQQKIFVSRSKANRRRIINENEIIELLNLYDYEIHYFEDYTLKQQIDIMSRTKVLIGLHGAGLTNMLFMPEDGKVLELRMKNDSHNNCYFSLASVLNHSYYYQLNEGDSVDTQIANVTVDLLELKKNLEILEG